MIIYRSRRYGIFAINWEMIITLYCNHIHNANPYQIQHFQSITRKQQGLRRTLNHKKPPPSMIMLGDLSRNVSLTTCLSSRQVQASSFVSYFCKASLSFLCSSGYLLNCNKAKDIVLAVVSNPAIIAFAEFHLSSIFPAPS